MQRLMRHSIAPWDPPFRSGVYFLLRLFAALPSTRNGKRSWSRTMTAHR